MEAKRSGRPKKEKGVRFSIYLDAETFKKIDVLAKSKGVTIYALISKSIRNLIAK